MTNVTRIMLLAANMPDAVQTETKRFTVEGPLIVASFDIGGFVINLTETAIVQFFIVCAFAILFFFLGRKLSAEPKGNRQLVAEYIVAFFRGAVKDSMGERYHRYVPYLASLFCLSLLSSLMGLFGLKAPTGDLSVPAAWGLITFILVQRNKLKTGGIKGWAGSLLQPVKFMLPFNIISEFANPLSQALRHFANILAGTLVGGLIYFALGQFALVVPAVLSLYFDIFSSVIQAYIFMMLTMVYVSMAECD